MASSRETPSGEFEETRPSQAPVPAPAPAPAPARPVAVPHTRTPPRQPARPVIGANGTIIMNTPPNSLSVFYAESSVLYASADRPGLVCKVALPLRDPLRCMAIERRIYERLAPLKLPNLVPVEMMDEYGIWMRHARYGNLRLLDERGKGTVISEARRLRWCEQVARVLAAVHDQGIRHADLSGRHLLVAGKANSDDSKIEIQLCDFGGSAIDGEKAMVWAEAGYRHPFESESDFPTIRCEIHALGSTFYEILMGQPVHHGRSMKEKQRLLEFGTYPDLTAVLLRDIIRECWVGEYDTVAEVADAVTAFRYWYP